MRIGIVSRDTETLIRECPGPEPAGTCPLLDTQTGMPPCAGQHVLLKLQVVGKPKSWMFRVAADVESCPVYLMGE